ncbi:outer membrane protein assembly factor BamB family protein [Neorhodopirellula pilleata]|uniref:Outer membrane protein assembly factor BamB n=1 Tax=Neorhodopirellula pilleata TaxID=2714738 RepID=A0A5C6A8C5_9BACT|nr:PQQ-binding-like beta-propeller repeat protein [Neorhodopirellula pilleata]TWT95640.1 Outer membrane protein assembly factor BamB precursor [Neorhodopirellula pilleata]
MPASPIHLRLISLLSSFVHPFVLTLTVGLALGSSADALDAWPQFRGPSGDGIVVSQTPPIVFGEDQNVTWKTPLPGKAWSSPVVQDGVIWVTTAIERTPTDEERLELLKKTDNDEKKFGQLAIAKAIELKAIAIDFANGKVLKTIDLVTVENPDAIHSLNSYASPTPVIDGDALYCHFGTFGTFALDRISGTILWQRTLPLQHAVGPGSSPLVHGNRLILIQDGMDRQYVTALNKQTGETLWETDRPPMEAPTGDQKKAYCTPIIATDSNGRDQLLCMGSQWMVSYDSETGEEFWRLYHGKGFSVVPRPVVQDDTVFFSTGFGKPQLWAVKIDGSGDVTSTHVRWTVTKGIPAKPSPLIHDGLIYVVDDNGVASCFDCQDGTEIWKKRLGGKFSASPILAGGHLYFGNHEGEVIVMTPGEDAEIVQTNQVSGQIMASPAVIDNALIVRTDQAIYRFE